MNTVIRRIRVTMEGTVAGDNHTEIIDVDVTGMSEEAAGVACHEEAKDAFTNRYSYGWEVVTPSDGDGESKGPDVADEPGRVTVGTLFFNNVFIASIVKQWADAASLYFFAVAWAPGHNLPPPGEPRRFGTQAECEAFALETIAGLEAGGAAPG